MAIVADPGPLIRSKAGREELAATLAVVAPGNALVFVDALDRFPKDGRLTGDRGSPGRGDRGGRRRGPRVPGADDGRDGPLDRGPGERARDAARARGRPGARRAGRRRSSARATSTVAARVSWPSRSSTSSPCTGSSGPVTADDVEALVAEAVPASTWALLDAIAWRRIRDAADLLDRVLDATPEPVVLVQLHRRLRELLEVADLVATGTPIRELPRVLKLHPFRAETAREAGRRLDARASSRARSTACSSSMRWSRAPAGRWSASRTRRLAFTLWLATRVAPADASARGRGGAVGRDGEG